MRQLNLRLLVVGIVVAGISYIDSQSLESDEQFSSGFAHHDIGRISGQKQTNAENPQTTPTYAQAQPARSLTVQRARSRDPQATQPTAVAVAPPVRTTPIATPAFLAPVQAPASAPALASAPVYVSQPAFASFQSSSSLSSYQSFPVTSQPQDASVSSPIAESSIPDQLTAPSYESVLSQGCPAKGVFSYEHAEHCDRYFLCTNGTFSEESCPNGLSYGTQGVVYQHCAYRWNIDCGKKKSPGPISSPGCPWQFGVFPIESAPQCSIDYYECEWGVPEVKRCHPEGLFYDDRIKGCQWADQLGCKSEGLLNFKCPHEDEDNPYWPYPRYYHSKSDVIVCVNEQPRLVHCTDDQHVEPESLACIDNEKKKKPKKNTSF